MKKNLIFGGVLVLVIIGFIMLSSSEQPSEQSEQEASSGDAVSTPPSDTPAPISAHTKFGNPEPVTIQGYSGPQEDPVISSDGKYLFFDNHDDIGSPTNLFMATRIDYKTFKFIGKIPGVNIGAVEGVEDSAHNFYLVSPVLLGRGGATTIGRGTFSDGSVSGIAPLKGISPKPAPSGSIGITFDLFITPDGNTLYFSDFVVDAQFKPQGAQLAMATKNADGSFTRSSNSDEILKNVNGLSSLVYNATPSADGLELVFNATPGYPNRGATGHIYIATRSSPSAPFGIPQLVAAADLSTGQLSEPASFSPDGTRLYFHRVLTDTTSQLYVLTRE